MKLADELKYVSYADLGKLQYGRILWKTPRGQKLLLDHWLHPDHPHRERFQEFRPIIELVLNGSRETDEELDQLLNERGWSLRTALREIPSIMHNIPFGKNRG